MEHNVFNQPDVIHALAPFIVLQADITQNDATDRALLHYLGVIAPPTVIFFDESGQERISKRIVGQVSKANFLTHLKGLAIL